MSEGWRQGYPNVAAAIAALAPGGVPPSRLVATTAPLAGGGNLSADRTLSIAMATALVDGYLSAADFVTFAAKVAASRTVGTTAPLTGGGNLSADRTLAIAKATAAVDGYLAAADFATFAAAAPSSRSIATTAPITGGGNLSADRTLAIAKATAAVDGYLAAADFATFAAAVPSARTIAGLGLSADITASALRAALAIPQTLVFGCANLGAVSADRWLLIGASTAAPTATQAQGFWTAAAAGTITSWVCELFSPTVTDNCTFALQIDGSDSGPTSTIPQGNLSDNHSGLSIALGALHHVGFRFKQSGTESFANIGIRAALTFVPS